MWVCVFAPSQNISQILPDVEDLTDEETNLLEVGMCFPPAPCITEKHL